MPCGQKTKHKSYYSKFNKDFKNLPHQKRKKKLRKKNKGPGSKLNILGL